jgi:ABC-type sulfate/molybdate transport systems ATPase subunit
MSELTVDIHLTSGDFELRAALAVSDRELVALVGPNGAGKTTLLRAILGVLPPTKGHVSVGERTLFDSRDRVEIPTERRRIGYVPQDYGLFPHLDVLENIRFGLDARRADWSAERRDSRARELLARFELNQLASRRPPNLSGGERQRVALARALASEPDVLLLDEPLAALDITARRRVRDTLAEHLDGLTLPTLMVTHDPADVTRLADRVVVLENGRITASARDDRTDTDFSTQFFDSRPD